MLILLFFNIALTTGVLFSFIFPWAQQYWYEAAGGWQVNYGGIAVSAVVFVALYVFHTLKDIKIDWCPVIFVSVVFLLMLFGAFAAVKCDKQITQSHNKRCLEECDALRLLYTELYNLVQNRTAISSEDHLKIENYNDRARKYNRWHKYGKVSQSSFPRFRCWYDKENRIVAVTIGQ